jgi:cytochrome P450
MLVSSAAMKFLRVGAWLSGINQTHQDSQLYPEPERFDPDRFSSERSAKPFSYVPFGGGLRECLGKEFARLEMKLFAAKIVRELEWELLPIKI